MVAVQYTATAQHTTTTSSAPSGRRRSAGKPTPSRIDPEEFSEAPTKAISKYGTKKLNILNLKRLTGKILTVTMLQNIKLHHFKVIGQSL